jgi:hypothetical protein
MLNKPKWKQYANFFIKSWLDSSQKANHTRKILICGLVCLASYGLFVSTIDRKRINYVLYLSDPYNFI